MKTEIISTRRIGETGKRELFDLFRQFYANTDFDRFCADFSGKHWLIRMRDHGRLAGFSTQQQISLGDTRFLYSGDTIVHPDYWNKSHLAGAFGHLFLHIAAESAAPLYWFLISKGYRTYRFLPVFFNRFHPRHDGSNMEMKSLLDAIAAHKFGDHYNAQNGLIEFGPGKDHLKESLAHIPPHRQADPHVAFFAKANPCHHAGTELACIAPLARDNLTRCGDRVIQSTKVEWHA
jgi:hypothetical protein